MQSGIQRETLAGVDCVAAGIQAGHFPDTRVEPSDYTYPPGISMYGSLRYGVLKVWLQLLIGKMYSISL